MKDEKSKILQQTYMILAALKGSKGNGLNEMENWARRVDKEDYTQFLCVAITYMNLNLCKWILKNHDEFDYLTVETHIRLLESCGTYDMSEFRDLIIQNKG